MSRQILFLPGANTPSEFYGAFFEKLSAAGYQVETLDYPGIGNKEVLTENPDQTEADYMRWLGQEVKKRSQLKDYILMGFSLGGYLAYKYATEFADEELAGLVLFSPLTRLYSKNLGELALRFLVNEWQDITSRREDLSYSLFHWKNLLYLDGKFEQTDFVRALEPHYDWSHKDLPMFVYAGGRDLVVDTKLTEEIFADRENVKLVIKPELGHDAFSLSGEEVIAELNEFNASLAGSESRP